MEEFIEGYLEALFWSEVIDQGTEEEPGPLNGDLFDDHFGPEDLDPEVMEEIRKDCEDFYEAHADEWQGQISDAYAGHNFCLSRNGHGAGFFDAEGLSEDLREKLQDECDPYGSQSLYLGDDGKVYVGC